MVMRLLALALALLMGVVSADEAKKKPNIVLFLWYAGLFFRSSVSLRR